MNEAGQVPRVKVRGASGQTAEAGDAAGARAGAARVGIGKSIGHAALVAVAALGACALFFGACALVKTCAGVGAGAGADGRYACALYIYMCGSTLETKSAIATANIDEMLGARMPDGTAVVVETGGARKWRGHDIPSDALVRYELRGGRLVEVEREADASMGDADTLASFLEFCTREYPADNSTLLLWDHGAGSVKGVCADENHGMDALSAAELGQALDAADAHFTTVCFDACLMGGFETMRVVAPHAQQMVASEEIEPAAGWDYTALVENLGSADFTEKLLAAYQARNEAKGKRLYTLSAVDLGKFAQVETAFDALCEEVLSKKGSEGALQEVVQAADSAMGFGDASGRSATQSELVDLSQFSRNLGFEELARAIGECTRTANGADREGACGMSIYFPVGTASSLRDYLASATSSAYALFLRNNFGEGADATGGEKIRFSDEGSVQGGALQFGVTPESTRYVQEVAYAVYRLDDGAGDGGQGGEGGKDGGEADCLGFSDDVTSRGTGAYAIGFAGKWVALNGHLLSCDTIDSTGDTTVFSAPVKKNGEAGDLRFTFNAKTGAYALQGFVASEKAGAPGRLEDIQPNDTLVLLVERITGESTDAGNAGEGSDGGGNAETRLVEGATVSAADGLELSSAALPDGRYQVYGVVTDIYGGEHVTRDFIVYLEGGAIVQAQALDS